MKSLALVTLAAVICCNVLASDNSSEKPRTIQSAQRFFTPPRPAKVVEPPALSSNSPVADAPTAELTPAQVPVPPPVAGPAPIANESSVASQPVQEITPPVIPPSAPPAPVPAPPAAPIQSTSPAATNLASPDVSAITPPRSRAKSVPAADAPFAPVARVGTSLSANTNRPMELSFQVNTVVDRLGGSILRGKGFRVWADRQSGSNGTLRFLFQQMYRGLPLNEWSGGASFPAPFEGSVGIDLPPPDASPFTVICEYDLHTIQLAITNSEGLLAHRVLWRDNMTDALGNDGPIALTVDHPAVSDVAFAPADPLPPSPYVWEGVIGNTSHAPVGPSVHSPWWPISKMVSRGNIAFYTCGYNEGKWDVQKFDVSNPQVVVTNFSATGRKQIATAWPVDLSFPNDQTLLVKYSDGNIVAFDPQTTAKLAEKLTEWPESPVAPEGASAVAVHPGDSNIVAVYYKSSDQVVVYGNAASTNGWVTNLVIGAAGGYANGPAVAVPTNTPAFRETVKLSGLYYDADGTTNSDARITNAVLCFQQDGKLWVSDTLTSRMLRFDTEGLCDSWFMFVAHTYNAYADPNDPKRVFAGNLEFEVSYTNAISNCWTLRNCWTRYVDGAEIERGKTTQNGLFSVVTLTNNGTPRTFALMRDPGKLNRRQLVELTAAGVRQTGQNDLMPFIELDIDGSTVAMSVGPTPQTGTTAYFYRDTISQWIGNDPVYTRSPLGIVEYVDNVFPIYWGAAKLRDSKLFLFYPSKNQFERDIPAVPFTGYHLGAVDLSQAGTWLWVNSPSGPLDGRGTFENNCHYAGSGFTVVDDNIFFAYRGEGWRGGQANQIFHYKTDGTFVGQFGTPAFVQGTLQNAPGAAGNVFNISAVKVDGTIYLYTSDEWSHGVHRWRIDNADVKQPVKQ